MVFCRFGGFVDVKPYHKAVLSRHLAEKLEKHRQVLEEHRLRNEAFAAAVQRLEDHVRG